MTLSNLPEQQESLLDCIEGAQSSAETVENIIAVLHLTNSDIDLGNEIAYMERERDRIALVSGKR